MSHDLGGHSNENQNQQYIPLGFTFSGKKRKKSLPTQDGYEMKAPLTPQNESKATEQCL